MQAYESDGGRVSARPPSARFQAEAGRHRRRIPRPRTIPRSNRSKRWPKRINAELDRLFPKDIENTGRAGPVFWWATAGTSVAKVIGKATRDGKTLLLPRRRRVSHVLGASFSTTASTISRRSAKGAHGDLLRLRGRRATRWIPSRWPRKLPELELGDYVYSENIGGL